MKDANGHPTTSFLDQFSDQPWACEFVEGAPAHRTRASGKCRGCVLARGAMLANGYVVSSRRPDGRHPDSASWYEEHRHAHGLPPLPERRSARGQSCG